jgi:hypothetical protein
MKSFPNSENVVSFTGRAEIAQRCCQVCCGIYWRYITYSKHHPVYRSDAVRQSPGTIPIALLIERRGDQRDERREAD